jgi:hypothetical protein
MPTNESPVVISPSDILTPEELCKRLQVRISWIREKSRPRSARDNPLPTMRIGRYLRFNWPDVCAWLRSTSNVQSRTKRR